MVTPLLTERLHCGGAADGTQELGRRPVTPLLTERLHCG